MIRRTFQLKKIVFTDIAEFSRRFKSLERSILDNSKRFLYFLFQKNPTSKSILQKIPVLPTHVAHKKTEYQRYLERDKTHPVPSHNNQTNIQEPNYQHKAQQPSYTKHNNQATNTKHKQKPSYPHQIALSTKS